MKKKILVIAAIIICMTCIAGGSYAYFVSSGVAHNVITSAAVDIDIEEWQVDAQGNRQEYPTGAIPVMPSTQVSKMVAVRNLDEESYIRARFDVVIKTPDGSVYQTDSDSDASIMHKIQSEKPIVNLTMAQSSWIREGDWWYYRKPVDTREITDELISKVTFDGPNMTNEYQNMTLEILVMAEAVQSANNPIPDGGDVSDVQGWPNQFNP